MKSSKINVKAMAISVIIIIVLFTIYGLKLFSDKENYNGPIKVSNKITTDKKYKNLDITNIKVFKLKKLYHINFDVNNNSEKKFQKQSIKLVFLDENKNVLKKKNVVIPDTDIGSKNSIDVVIEEKETKSDNMLISDR